MSSSPHSPRITGLSGIRSLSVDPATAVSSSFLQLLLPNPTCAYLDVEGPANPEETLIIYDVPFAPSNPKYSLKIRKALRLPAVEERPVDPNVRVVLDSFIKPRRWKDEKGVVLVQHASPFPVSRTDTLKTQERLHEKLAQYRAKRTGICPVRTLLVAECFLEVIRQVTAECWERGLLLLHIHAERVASQAAHRELFESRVGHSFRLALKGEKDTARVIDDIAHLKERIASLVEEEEALRTQCDEFAEFAEEQVLINEKQHNDVMAALRKEGLIKRNQLENMVALPSAQ